MAFTIESTGFPEINVVVMSAYEDHRGFFMEVYREDQFGQLGFTERFVQDNQSLSMKNVVRGMHFQWKPSLGKLIRVVHGGIFLAIVDIRKGSPRLGKWIGMRLASADRKHVWVPPGFANGFCALEDETILEYKFTMLYNGGGEGNILWNDPEIGIEWPVEDPVISERDRRAPRLREWLAMPESDHFRFQA